MKIVKQGIPDNLIIIKNKFISLRYNFIFIDAIFYFHVNHAKYVDTSNPIYFEFSKNK